MSRIKANHLTPEEEGHAAKIVGQRKGLPLQSEPEWLAAEIRDLVVTNSGADRIDAIEKRLTELEGKLQRIDIVHVERNKQTGDMQERIARLEDEKEKLYDCNAQCDSECVAIRKRLDKLEDKQPPVARAQWFTARLNTGARRSRRPRRRFRREMLISTVSRPRSSASAKSALVISMCMGVTPCTVRSRK